MRADYNVRLRLPAIPSARACFQLLVVRLRLNVPFHWNFVGKSQPSTSASTGSRAEECLALPLSLPEPSSEKNMFSPGCPLC